MKNWIESMKKRFKNEKGLTLVELLAVVVILAIVGTVAFVMIGSVIENSKKDAHIANAQQLIASAKLHDAQGGFGDENTVTSSELHSAGILDELIDPWTKKASNDYSGTVTKDTKGDAVTYKVTLSKTGKCTINGAEESDVYADDARKTFCNK